MKKTISMILALMLCVSLLAIPAAAADTEGDWEYAVADGEATVLHYHGSETELTIPAVLGNCPVTGIGYMAFFSDSTLTSVAIPEGVTRIEDMAFMNCSALKSITLPTSLVNVGLSTFHGTSWIDSFGDCAVVNGMLLRYSGSEATVVIPEGVTRIATDAFVTSTMETLVLPDSLVSIAGKGVQRCPKLREIRFGNGLQVIENEAFSACVMLERVAIPDSVRRIGNGAFVGCSALTDFSIGSGLEELGEGVFTLSSLKRFTVSDANPFFKSVDGVLFSKDGTVLYAYPRMREEPCYTVPAGVKRIANYAFAHSSAAVEEIRLPEGIERIDENAFFTTYAKKINLPNGLVSIGAGAFLDAGLISEITVPGSVREIGTSAFSNCSSLSSVTLEAGIPAISGGMFSSCNQLTELKIPEGAGSVGDSAFYCCRKLSSVSIPDSVVTIGARVFAGCSTLAEVRIGSGVQAIDEESFPSYLPLTDVYYTGTEQQWKTIQVGRKNEKLADATLHFSVASEAGPIVQRSPQKLRVNGAQIDCEKYNIDGSNFFMLRDLGYMLNGTGSQFAVGWDGATGTVTVTAGKPYEPNGSELAVGADLSDQAVRSAQTIVINGVVRGDLAVYNIGGHNFFKLRDLGDALGFDVDYDQSTNTAVVKSR